MPCSMTGMGKAVHRGKECSIEVEVKSVNNRYLVIKNHFSDSLMKIEPRLHVMAIPVQINTVRDSHDRV